MKHKSITGQVLEHGSAPYLNKKENNESYFVKLKLEGGTEHTLWSTTLPNALTQGGVRVGDWANFNSEKEQHSNYRNWSAEKIEIEEDLNLENSIEQGFEQEKEAFNSEVVETSTVLETEQKRKIKDPFNYAHRLPKSVETGYYQITKNFGLLKEKVNFYDDKGLAFEDKQKILSTSRQDVKTISAMLDMAQAKGWNDLKIKGTEEFKRQVWLEANLRGLAVKGYTPTDRDVVELQKMQENTKNSIDGQSTQKESPISEMMNANTTSGLTSHRHNETSSASMTDKELSDNEKIETNIEKYHHLDVETQNNAYLQKIGQNFEGAEADRQANSFEEVREQAKQFTGKELTNFHSGITATVSRNALDKMLSGKASEKSIDLKTHLVAVANVDKLFENSILGWQTNHKTQDRNTESIHRAISPLKINDEVFIAKLTVKEFANEIDGNRLYSVEAIELEQEKSPIPEMVADDHKYGARTDRLNKALIDIIVENAQQYNISALKDKEKFAEKLPYESTRDKIFAEFRQGVNDKTINSMKEFKAMLINQGYEARLTKAGIIIKHENLEKDIKFAVKDADIKGTQRDNDLQVVREKLKPENIQRNYPNITPEQLNKVVELTKNMEFIHKDTSKNELLTKLQSVEENIGSIVAKNVNLPTLPQLEQAPKVEAVELNKSSEKERGR